MGAPLIFDVEGLDPLEFRSPSWEAFAAWNDAFVAGQVGDAEHNLCVACAIKPGPAEFAALVDDEFGFLPNSIADSLLEAGGLPGGLAGFGTRFELVKLEDAPGAGVPAELVEAAKGRARRPLFALTPLGWWAVKAPGGRLASAYQDGIGAAFRGQGSHGANMRTLVLSCVLSPEPEIAKAKIEECPGIVLRLAPALRAAGGEGKAVPRARA